MRTAALILAALLAAPALAHDVSHRVGTAPAVTVALAYADGKPFAYETYELFPEGADVPAQVGRTDGQGRVVFVPGEQRKWRLRAFSGEDASATSQTPPENSPIGSLLLDPFILFTPQSILPSTRFEWPFLGSQARKGLTL